jgi:D-sedoheptulose 7-phosphate isomerase
LKISIQHYWHSLAALAQALDLDGVAAAAEKLLACQRRGGTVFVFGNGGSAATASHFACDLAKGTRVAGGGGVRVIALTDSTPLMTAWANDADFGRVFAEQLVLLARPGDLVVAISASGNSPNVLHGVETAVSIGAETIALTGWPGGKLCAMVDLALRTPDASIELVEDAHLAIAHSLCVALRERLAADTLGMAVEPAAPLALELGR